MGKKRKQRRPEDYQPMGEQPRKKLPPLEARTTNQGYLISDLDRCELTFALGPAGTGKTYIAARKACEKLKSREIEKIIVTRPMVTAEEEMGFLPGETIDKFAPFFAPVREILEADLGKSYVENLVKLGKIEIAPIAFLRGHTFKNAFVILDEAQNTTPKQMQLFLTRIGEGAQVALCGDLQQCDIEGDSGLRDAVNRFGNLPEAGVVRFGIEDVVRSGLARKIVEGYCK